MQQRVGLIGLCIASGAFAAACPAAPPVEPGVECGAGTEEVSGTCVPVEDNTPVITCGTGTVEQDGACVPESTLACGAGSVEVNGECVPEYEQVLCGDGTTLVDGECLPEPIDISDIQLTHLQIGDGTVTDLTLHAPVDVSVALEITGEDSLNGEVATVVLLNSDTTAFCMLGSFAIDQLNDGTEQFYKERFFVDADCARDAAKNDVALPTTLYAAVLIDAYNSLALSDPTLEEPIELTPGTDNPRADDCVRDFDGQTGDCVVTYSLDASVGIEFEVNDLELRTQAVVLPNACDPDDPEWAAVPEAYRCNGSIVLNEDGNYVYGQPDIALDLTVLAWGIDHKQDVATPEESEPPNLLSEEDLDISYEIKPVRLGDTDYLPAYLHSEGDPAKAGDETIPADMPSHTATDQRPKVPQTFSHGLYIENDCGENNLLTCDDTVNPRDEMLTGAWANDTLFDVRACVTSAAETVTDSGDNNCITTQVMITREGGVVPDTGGGLGFNWAWSNNQGFGNSWLAMYTALTAEANMQANAGDLNSAIGGRVNMVATLEFRSDVAGLSVQVIQGGGGGAANQNGCILGTCADLVTYGAYLNAFGIQIFNQQYSHGTTVDWASNPSWSRSFGRTFYYNFGPALVEIYFGAGAETGVALDAELTVGTTTSGWLAGQGVGIDVGGQGNVKPYATAFVTASASVNLWVIRAGARGTINIVSGGLPANITANVGFNTGAPTQLKMELSSNAGFEITILSGYIEVFLDHRWISCGWSGCSWTWSSWYTWRVAQWAGWVYGYQFYNFLSHKQFDFSNGSLSDI